MSTMLKTETLPEAEPKDVNTPASPQQREEVIRKGVLATLGRPTGLLKVAVLPLWGNKYRVNVWTGEGAVALPFSYFITADDRGNILGSEPRIQKLY